MRNLLKFIAFFVLSLSLATPEKTQAQVITGGEFSITFINGFNVDIAPIVGYRYKKFTVGVSPVIMYTAMGAMGSVAGTFSYGGRIFCEYDIYKGFFGHAEFGALNTAYIDDITDLKERNWVMSAPIGVGYETLITKGLYFKTMVLYDVLLEINLDQHSPLANPSIRGGLTYVF